MAGLDAQNALLATWQRWVEIAHTDEHWVDGRNRGLDRNSIMDAELLECLLLPHFYLDRFALDAPGEVDPFVANILNRLDDTTSVIGGQLAPGVRTEILDRLDDFLSRYASVDEGFSPGGYLEAAPGSTPPTPLPPVVDSFTMSLSVCLQALHLIDRWKEDLGSHRGSQEEIDRLDGLRERLSDRLTGAMLGLCRSFAVSVTDRDDWRRCTERPWPESGSSARTLRDIGRRLSMFADGATLRDNAFECGWSWGPTPPDSFEQEYDTVRSWPEQELYAESAPYLYFTIGAIDGIGDLFSRKIVAAHLLTSEQSALATRLGFYRECAASYWSALAFARTEKGAWAVEDPPWRTADGNASDYWTLYLLTIALASDQARETFGGELKLSRLLSLLEELAQRSRVTRRPHPPELDPAITLHLPPGEQLELRTVTADDAPGATTFAWSIYDFAPRLLKLAGQVLGIATERHVRDRASRLIDAIWNEHLMHRRVAPEKDAYAWDDVRRVFGAHPVARVRDDEALSPGTKVGSWYITERVVEALVAVVAAEHQRRAGGRLSSELAAEVLDDVSWTLTTQFPDETALIRRVNDALEVLDESPTVALGIALDISRHIDDRRKAVAENLELDLQP